MCPPWGLHTFHGPLYFDKVRNLIVTLGSHQLQIFFFWPELGFLWQFSFLFYLFLFFKLIFSGV